MTIYHLLSDRHSADIRRYVSDLCRALAADAHDVNLVCRRAMADSLHDNGAQIHTMRLGGAWDILTPIRLSKLWDSHDEGVMVHVHTLRDAATAIRTRNLCRHPDRIRILLSLHHNSRTRSPKTAMNMYNEMDGIILPSEHALTRFIGEMPDIRHRERLHAAIPCLNHPGQGLSPKSRPPATPLFNIIFTGPINADSGLDVLVHALASIPDKPWHLHVYGTGAPRVTMPVVHLSRGRNIDSRISWHGDEVDPASVITQCHISVIPYRGPDLQSFTIIEHMSHGLAVVAADTGGATEIITPGVDGITVPPNRPEVLAEALSRLMSDHHAMVRIAADGQRTATDRLSFQKHYNTITALYRQ